MKKEQIERLKELAHRREQLNAGEDPHREALRAAIAEVEALVWVEDASHGCIFRSSAQYRASGHWLVRNNEDKCFEAASLVEAARKAGGP